MSTTQLQQQQQQQSTGGTYTGQAASMIEIKFNELATRILDEFKQVHYSREFFQAIDVILKEPPRPSGLSQLEQQNKGGRLSRSSSRSKTSIKDSKREAEERKQREEEKQLLKNLLSKQQEQQEQLDNHTKLLIDSQYKTVANSYDKKSPLTKSFSGNRITTSKTTSALDKQITSAPASSSQQSSLASKRKSAIPQSTALSGSSPSSSAVAGTASGKTGGAQANYSLTRSATIAGSSNLANQSPRTRAADLSRLVSPQSTVAAAAAAATLMTASEKLRQRRPTRALLDDRFAARGGENDESDSTDDDEDEDDEYDHATSSSGINNLAARRAQLNERFLTGFNHETTSETSRRHEPAAPSSTTRQSYQQQPKRPGTVQRSSTICGSSSISNQQRDAGLDGFRKVPMSSKGNHSFGGDGDHFDNDDDDGREPRSIGTVQMISTRGSLHAANGTHAPITMSHLYKPHMNYSTSTLGNHHRLSDDDEIIIIPTTRSPTVSPALFASRNCSPLDAANEQHQQQQMANFADDEDLNNMDELSERFSISRTKSFWEKLTNSKLSPKATPSNGGAELQQRHLSKSPSDYSNVVQPALVGVHSFEGSPNGNSHDDNHHRKQQQQQPIIGKNDLSPVNSTKQRQQHDSAKHQRHNRRGRLLDSSGGSGNSNYSCSSGSGDENGPAFQTAQPQKSLSQVNARSSVQSMHQHQQPPKRTNCPKTVAAISQQLQEMSRANRFRQTR